MGIYLDYAATTPLDPRVETAMRPYWQQLFYNPSADYAAAKQVRQALNEARSSIARQMGAKPGEIVFTAGGTEANNLAIHGVMRTYPGAKMLFSALEHDSVRAPAGHYNSQTIPVHPDGLVDLDALARLIDNRTVLISLMYANKEIGVIEPLRQVSALVGRVRRQRRLDGVKLPLYIHSDACQAAGYLDLHVHRLGVDLLSINGSKLYGPKQSGALFIKTGTGIVPLVEGGGQENSLRSGTENVPGSIGLAKALEICQADREREVARLTALRARFTDRLLRELPGTSINGSLKYRLPNNVHVSFANQDNEVLLIGLDRAGIMAAAGSACSAAKTEVSPVLTAIGLSESQSRSSLRFSFGRGTTSAQLDRVIETLAQLVK